MDARIATTDPTIKALRKREAVCIPIAQLRPSTCSRSVCSQFGDIFTQSHQTSVNLITFNLLHIRNNADGDFVYSNCDYSLTTYTSERKTCEFPRVSCAHKKVGVLFGVCVCVFFLV